MFFLYLDESGSNTSHFVFLGIAIPATSWREKTDQVAQVKSLYGLSGKEIHTGWMMRRYLEQERIPHFSGIDRKSRRTAVETARKADILHISALGNARKLRDTKKYFKKTHAYIHLTIDERKDCVRKLADVIGSWSDSRLFGEATDIARFNLPGTVFENAFAQVISRFHSFLDNYGRHTGSDLHGLVIQDNNETVADRLTDRMRTFHLEGTMWTEIPRIIETPLFVNSELTEMIQISDVCAYATRRFFENKEDDLFDRIYTRFDRSSRGRVVGLRHYTGFHVCDCRVCRDHNP